MATSKTTVAVEINANASQAEGAVGSFKKQLKEATAELVNMSMKFGESSVEAQNAAKKVAGLKDAIGDAKALADTFNPDKKFVALGGALQGATAGFSALQGAMGLFGSESDDLNKTLMKVQSAMALQQGISGVFGAIDSFKMLKTEVMGFGIVQKIVTAGQWLWNAAMAANPIGAIVAVVAALIAGIVALTSWLIKSSDAAKQNAQQIKESAKALEEQKKSADKAADALKRNTDYTLEMLKASGATTAEIRKAEQALAAKAVVEARTAFEVALHTREIERQALAQMKANGATEENIKAQTENLNKYTENLNEQAKRLTTAKQNELNIVAKHNVQITQEQTNANKKELDANKEKHDKLLQQQKDFQEKQKQLRLQLIDENQKLTLTEHAYNLLQLNKEYTDRIAAAGTNQELLALIEQNYSIKRREALNANGVIEKQVVELGENDKTKLVIDATQLRAANVIKASQQEVVVEQQTQEQKLATKRKALDDLQTIFGTETAMGKAVLLAKQALAIQEMIQSARTTLFTAKDVATKATVKAAGASVDVAAGAAKTSGALPFPANIPLIIGYVAQSIGIIAAIRSALRGVKGASAGSLAAPSPAAAAAPVITPQALTTRLDQAQVNQIGNAAARAYVVESDVSNNQERINRLNRAARIN